MTIRLVAVLQINHTFSVSFGRGHRILYVVGPTEGEQKCSTISCTNLCAASAMPRVSDRHSVSSVGEAIETPSNVYYAHLTEMSISNISLALAPNV
jgi:hypothetical protein